jgi:hypothetical protein
MGEVLIIDQSFLRHGSGGKADRHSFTHCKNKQNFSLYTSAQFGNMAIVRWITYDNKNLRWTMGKARLVIVLISLAVSVFLFGCGEKDGPAPVEKTIPDQAPVETETAEVVGLLPTGHIKGSMKPFIGLESFPMLQELDGEDPLNLASGAKGAVAAYTLLTKNTDSGEVQITKDHVFVIKYPNTKTNAQPEDSASAGSEKVFTARQAFEGYIEFFNRKKEGYSIVGLFNEPIRILIHKEGKLDSIIYQYDNYIFGAWNLQDSSRREAMVKVLLKNIKEAPASGN